MTDSRQGGTAGVPHVALVISTRDRAARLRACLRAVCAMRPDTAVTWELILVDNGSVDDTPRVLEEFAGAPGKFAGAAPVAVALVRETRHGLANARNAGVRAARAPLVAFIDDDCYPAPDFLDRWIKVFADPAVGFGGGRILLHDPDDHPITIRTNTEPVRIPPGGFVEPGLIQGANMAFRRAVVFAVGGFDPALGPGAAFNFEDLDMSARASAAGYAGGYFPQPVVYHHHGRRSVAAVRALEHSYDHGRGAYYASVLLRRRPLRPLAHHLVSALRHNRAGVLAREALAAAQYLAFRCRRRAERPLRGVGAPPASHG